MIFLAVRSQSVVGRSSGRSVDPLDDLFHDTATSTSVKQVGFAKNNTSRGGGWRVFLFGDDTIPIRTYMPGIYTGYELSGFKKKKKIPCFLSRAVMYELFCCLWSHEVPRGEIF